MKFFWFFTIFLFFLPLTLKASVVDLSLSQNSISFSKEILIAGDTVRIYATVKNLGEVDVSGYVIFYQGDLVIGNSQTISVRAGGVPEEVYVDFVVPSGSFNIRAKIQGADPEDQNFDNDSALTSLNTPIFDDDRDSVENKNDNCSSVENLDQADNDIDGLGDVCDDDDDNDSITDEVEKELSTSTTSSDTDSDGLLDAIDPHPIVPESQIKPVEKPETLPFVSLNQNQESFRPTSLLPDKELLESPAESEQIEEIPETYFSVSPKAVFSFKQVNWQTYFFQAQIPIASDYRVLWNFGDGVTSAKKEIQHVYKKSGDYLVKIKIEDSNGQNQEDEITIHVPFFSLQNKIIQIILGSLGVLLFLALGIFYRVGRRKPILPPAKKSSARKIIVRQETDIFDLE